MSSPAQPRLFRLACVLGLVGVAAGAFGAHALEGRVPAARVDTFETAVRIQLLHVPVLLVISLFPPGVWRRRASLSLLTGLVIFSGSLYALVLLDLPILGAVTPIGGLGLILGWGLLARSATSG